MSSAKPAPDANIPAKTALPPSPPLRTKLPRRYKKQLDNATKFIPTWVKVAVAIALGLGTMVGWKRIVVTVGEKIGKEHLTYAQGACAELVAMATIFAADNFGLPCQPPTCSVRAWPAPWPPIAAACRFPQFATSRRHGYSPSGCGAALQASFFLPSLPRKLNVHAGHLHFRYHT
jgi:hypothetical protein